ncbi:5-oxoprolinase subunit PxpB [Geojedonia litorea]|uniref:5-oxoprolinase subunit PxpB n=1 Tax=Geojedonia litorea TaxID=1268269 RepID=A0ABV9N500_9FLAO
MLKYDLTYKSYGERSILIEWPKKIDENILEDILNFKNCIIERSNEVIIQIKSAYNSILITYDLGIDNINTKISTLKTLYSARIETALPVRKLWKVPVCYDHEFALDLEYISKLKKLSKTEIVNIHSTGIYTVFFIGFLPGFLYLGGLDNRLITPRRSTPRLQINKGDVGIGGSQTGIYPNQSPGGWHIIGNSPILFFDASKKTPCFAKAGDKIQFVPIDLKTYRRIEVEMQAGIYNLESEVIDG